MRSNLQLKAWILLAVFTYEIFSPLHIMALGSGPSQPEMAAFTPAGTTEMVDPFTGDFTYNIPLMDVEGYPINIAYNSGVTMEQEASWVGLGWNLNVGTINRSVRGLPDDFKGDLVQTETSMKPMKVTKFGLGGSFEFAGKEDLLIRLGGKITFIHNSYKGYGIAQGVNIGSRLDVGGLAPNANLGLTINSLEGTSINSSLGLNVSKKDKDAKSMVFGGSLGTGYNTRTGQTMLSMGTTAGYRGKKYTNKEDGSTDRTAANTSLTGGSYLPIGMNSYTPNSSLKLKTSAIDFSGSVGGALWGVNPNAQVTGSQSIQEVKDKLSSNQSYGYLYSETAPDYALKDFNRDKEILLNKTTTNLSPINFTYDVFSVNGQGVSGTFRPFRNDIGILSDPAINYKASSSNSYGGEIGFGAYAHSGFNTNSVSVWSYYGPWLAGNAANSYNFDTTANDNTFENVYFKAAGERTENDLEHFNSIGGFDAVAFRLQGKNIAQDLKSSSGSSLHHLPEKNKFKREARAKAFSVLTAQEAQYAALDKIKSYNGGFYQGSYSSSEIPRIDNNKKEHHISEITQINPDGQRFVFGIPAYNNSKKEVVYTTANEKKHDALGNAKIQHNGDEASLDNESGVDGYFSRTTTPAFAHSFLLTAQLSADYQDVTGDGISPDDIGNAYKFGYQRTSSNYKWRSPYNADNFMEGFRSNKLDQKGSYTYGSKEQWYLHTVQSKNQVAEFYTSERDDALGTQGEAGGKPSSIQSSDRSFQLDSIVLFDKLDRLQNKNQAIPIKKIVFDYDYSLCKGVPNQVNADSGKLTLKSIRVTYGKSNIGQQSPYLFTYSSGNANPNYSADQMDRWGNYKPFEKNPEGMYNGDFPYTLQNQSDSLQNEWASAWSLIKIQMPSGGSLEIEYEADDYAYVQNKLAKQMYPVVGAGNTQNFFDSIPHDFLYDNDYLFIERPYYIPTDAPRESLKRWFLGKDGKEQHMYFKFLTSIGSAKTEYAAGYTEALDIGFCSDKNYMYVKINEQSPNPISKAAWGYFRQNLFDVLYKQPNINDSGLKSIIKGLIANIADISQMFTGVENKLRERKIANVFEPKRSFIRLNNAYQFKKGGGSRVKQLTLNDSWNSMSGEGQNASYGQEYDYTTTDEWGRQISSGVASYEPAIGNDENPFRQPIPYMATAKKGHIPAIKDYQETPFGESFVPSPTVGYSKVTVKNINYGKGNTANAFTEHNFYTAKDFPIFFKEVPIQKKDDPDRRPNFDFPFSNATRHSSFHASQGYSIILNDMHGKPKSTINYTHIETLANGSIKKSRKDLGGTIYNYKHKAVREGKMLDNEVEVMTTDGYLKKQLLGVEYDLAIDSRRSREENKSFSAQINVDVIPIPSIPPTLPLPTGYTNELKNITESRTLCVTKVIQMYGLIESVKTFTDQYATTSYNRLYDGRTGEVLLTETQDEHLQNEFQFSIPAHTIANQQRMGSAYENLHYEASISPYFAACNPNQDVYRNNGQLKHGDEVLIFPDSNSSDTSIRRAWVSLNLKRELPKAENCENKDYNRLITKAVDFPYQSVNRPRVCEPETIPTFERDSLYLKGERGEILEEVSIFHLNDSFASAYESFLNYQYSLSTGFATYLDNGNEEHHYSDLSYYYKSNQPWEKAADSLNTVFCGYFADPDSATNIFSNGRNLSFEIDDATAYGIPQIFDLNDTIHGIVEEASTFERREVSEVGNIEFSHGYWKEELFIYRQAYNSCFEQLELSPYYHNLIQENTFKPRDSSGLPLNDYDLKRRDFSKTTPITNDQGEVNWEAVERRSFLHQVSRYSKSIIRIQNDPVLDAHQDRYLQNSQPYLVKYTIKDRETDSLSYAYFIEQGKGYDTPELKSEYAYSPSCIEDLCPIQFSVWDSTKCTDNYIPCADGYQLLDRFGNPIDSLTEKDVLKVIRSGNRNLLSAKSGSVVSASNPIKLAQNGKYLGIKSASEGLEIFQTAAQTYTDSSNIIHSIADSANKFLAGYEATFRMDSSFRYIASRHQKSSIETSKDGYLNELPDLWLKEACERHYSAPNFSSNQSSSWQLAEDVQSFHANGLATQSQNILGINSALWVNYRNNVEAVASNCQQNNMAIDGFENYYTYGNGNANLPEPNFSLINTEGKDSTTHLAFFNAEENFQMVSYPDLKKLVKGVSHTGDYSLFVKGSNNTGNNNITLPYIERSITPLEGEEIGEPISDNFTALNGPYDVLKSNHKAEFIQGISSETLSEINEIEGSDSTEHNFVIIDNNANGLFQPQSGDYIISLWVKEMVASGTPYAGASAEVQLIHNGSQLELKAAGPAIDGWQKMEGSFTYDQAAALQIKFKGGFWGAFFDDLRIHPKASNLKTFVYDRYSGRLEATLDENNYATFYGYNKEGVAAQVKRETDLGIVTVSESRQSISQKAAQ